ncbi:MAG: hypothetical protein JO255_16080 [Alphaproteobacteria bacterium]|nr:hypothetical protein [Alphaproteobacteria bacterium]
MHLHCSGTEVVIVPKPTMTLEGAAPVVISPDARWTRSECQSPGHTIRLKTSNDAQWLERKIDGDCWPDFFSSGSIGAR